MAAFIKLASERTRVLVGLTLADNVTRHCTGSNMALELRGCRILGADGQPVDGPLKANQKVALRLGTLAPKKYQAMVECHPDLHAYGQTQLPRLIEPDDTVDLTLFFRADRAVDIASLPWIARVYLID